MCQDHSRAAYSCQVALARNAEISSKHVKLVLSTIVSLVATWLRGYIEWVMGRFRILFAWPVLIVLLVLACDDGGDGRDGRTFGPELEQWAVQTCTIIGRSVATAPTIEPVGDSSDSSFSIKQEYFQVFNAVGIAYHAGAIELRLFTPVPSELAAEHLRLADLFGDLGASFRVAELEVIPIGSGKELQSFVAKLIEEEEEALEDAAGVVAALPQTARTALQEQPGCESIAGGQS